MKKKNDGPESCSAEVGDNETGPWRGFRVRDGYPERDDDEELFCVRGGQGRSADELLEASGWLTMLLAFVSAAIVAFVLWRIFR